MAETECKLRLGNQSMQVPRIEDLALREAEFHRNFDLVEKVARHGDSTQKLLKVKPLIILA